ncbi:hypothetical protein BDV06DRAFT_195728 [Aspergillus oleicola]
MSFDILRYNSNCIIWLHPRSPDDEFSLLSSEFHVSLLIWMSIPLIVSRAGLDLLLYRTIFAVLLRDILLHIYTKPTFQAMRFFSLLSGLLLAGAAAAQSSSCSAQESDATVVEYAWALQTLLERYYTSQPINQTFLNSAVNGSRSEYYQNFLGIQRANRLGVRAIQQVGSKVPSYSTPRCTFTHPNATDGEDFVKNAILLEASVASAFIGAVPYTQAPEVSFMLARLASEHTAATTWLAGQQTGVLFRSNTSSLVPAYNPSYVLGTGDQTGRLGRWLGDCVDAPSDPCDQTFFIGPLVGSVGNRTSAAIGPGGSNNANSTSSSASASISPTAAARRLF